ncbi:aminoglycoside phosphotransferase family protein [Mumia sp. zg.B17]|uniref:phosphotransferase family protein n=1 Tax=unclassified Mumia TaxID=2621872 RepID=UPI001C6E559B|nr:MULTISPECIES: aminoglycoside phosphotransferase family protein [unclassified Mumia]MBW9207783.1 aminoglycoside phosphotransferase family protein [Mumia sp. zg.B17]MBW9209872.1 aminoglycoside phosphotransferase family protein [Mumia sp. zg.B21]MDD9349429.1 aminoglycoside phosphotransferase family protein [Mumia sp.]
MPLSDGHDHEVRRSERGTLVRRRLPGADCLTSWDEAALLRLVAAVSPLPVPQVLDVRRDDDVMEMALVPGGPLLTRLAELDQPTRDRLGADLGAFLSALHGIPVASVSGLVPVDDTAPADLLAEGVELLGACAGAIPVGRHRAVERFLESPAPRPSARRVLSHNDLGAEHVFVDEDAQVITGVIDWSDAALTDPALDLGLVLRDLGVGAFDRALDADDGEPEVDDLRTRAIFHARIRALEDLAYGIETDRDLYRRNASRAIAALFDDEG